LTGLGTGALTRVAVLGAGHWGPNLIRNFHRQPASDVTWIADADPARLAQVALRFPDVKRTRDPLEAVGAPDVDAVVIATPTVTHHSLTKAALLAGKHVLVEKPLAASLAEGEEVCRLAREKGTILMVGHVFLFNPGVRRVRQLLEEGALGRVYYASMVRTNLGPIRTDVDAAWDLAAQDISIANYWLDGMPLSVSCLGGSWINRGINDAVFATLRYKGDVLVHLHVSWLHPRKARDITVVGAARMLILDDMNLAEPLRIYDKGVREDGGGLPWVDSFGTFRSSLREGDILIPRVSLGEPLKEECEHFVHCVETGERPITDGSMGLAVVRVLEALDRSARNAGRVEPV
jgi:predicted dehydrogenase